jgi:hypothetical protein
MDNVNKVIAAILEAETLEGGRKKKSRQTRHVGGRELMNLGVRLHGGEDIEGGSSGISGGSCSASVEGGGYKGYYKAKDGLYYKRGSLRGGATEVAEANAPATTTEVAASAPVVESAEPLTGGKKGSSRKRKLNPALKRQRDRTMKIYNQMIKENPNMSGKQRQASMKSAMRQAARSK